MTVLHLTCLLMERFRSVWTSNETHRVRRGSTLSETASEAVFLFFFTIFGAPQNTAATEHFTAENQYILWEMNCSITVQTAKVPFCILVHVTDQGVVSNLVNPCPKKQTIPFFSCALWFRRHPDFVKLTSGFSEVDRDSKIQFAIPPPPHSHSIIAIPILPDLFHEHKNKGKFNRCTSWLFSCNVLIFCHVYKGIVSH